MKFRNWLLAPLMALVLAAGINIGSGVVAPQQAQAADLSNYLENKLVDALLRNTAYTMPTNVYVALETAAGSDTGCGTEAAYTGYARVTVASSTTNWAGTQSAGSTAVSSGTGGTTSNNIAITFGAPTSGPTTVTGFCVMDASTSGNLLFRHALTTSKTLNNGDAAPSFAIGALTFQLDN